MGAPLHHANESVSKHGGTIDDYLDLHEFLDSSSGVISDNRHRALTHNSWFITTIVPRVFGSYITNSYGKHIPVKDLCYEHILSDFHQKFIPSAQDYLENLSYEPWMQNGAGLPPSAKKLAVQDGRPKKIRIDFD